MDARCRLDRMSAVMRVRESLGMRGSPASGSVARAPDNELYDRGADLVEAAMAIRRVAGSPEASRAVPAVLGCIESALQELAVASPSLEQATAEVASTTPGCLDRRADRVVDRMHRGYANLQGALFDAHAAAAAARALTSRATGRPGRGS
jgi:hypothetical protein